MKNMIILDTTFLALNERTANGWVLGTKAAKRMVKEFNENLEKRNLVVFENNADYQIHLEDAVGKLRSPGLRIIDNKIVGEIELLDTPKGKVADIITAGKGCIDLYGDLLLEVVSHDDKPRSNDDYKSIQYCVLTGVPGVTSKQRYPVKRYDIPVLEKEDTLSVDGAELTKKENMVQKVKLYPVGSIVKVVGNIPTKGKVGQVDCVTGIGFGTHSYEIIDENGTNFFVVGTENLEEYKGFFERKDKYGENPLAEPEKLDVIGTISRKVNEAKKSKKMN